MIELVTKARPSTTIGGVAFGAGDGTLLGRQRFLSSGGHEGELSTFRGAGEMRRSTERSGMPYQKQPLLAGWRSVEGEFRWSGGRPWSRDGGGGASSRSSTADCAPRALRRLLNSGAERIPAARTVPPGVSWKRPPRLGVATSMRLVVPALLLDSPLAPTPGHGGATGLLDARDDRVGAAPEGRWHRVIGDRVPGPRGGRPVVVGRSAGSDPSPPRGPRSCQTARGARPRRAGRFNSEGRAIP